MKIRQTNRDQVGRRLSPLRATTALVVLAVLASLPVAEARAEVINRVLLRVNDRIVTQWDYERDLALHRSQIVQAVTDRNEQDRRLSEAPLQVMKSLFDELLVLSRADQLGLTISQLELEEAVKFRWEQFGIETDEQFRTALRQSGMTEGQFREDLAKQMLRQRVVGRELMSRIDVRDEELRDVYKENQDEFRLPEERKLVEVVLIGDASEASILESAESLRRAWVDGSGAPDLGKELANELGGEAAQWVDVGWVSEGDLAPELEQVAWQLSTGEISEPTEGRGGLHLIQVVEIKEASIRPFEEVRERIFSVERSKRLDDEMESYLEELEQKSYFKSDLPPELADFRTKTGRSLREASLGLFSSPAPFAEGTAAVPEAQELPEPSDQPESPAPPVR